MNTKRVDYRYIISRTDEINRLNNSKLGDKGSL